MLRRSLPKWGQSLLICPTRSKIRILPKESYSEDETSLWPKQAKPGKSQYVNILAMFHRKWTLKDIVNVMKERQMEALIKDQKYLVERHSILGPDLAAAHFLGFRGGRVKFKGLDKWITDKEINDGEIPNRFVKGFLLEEIDISHSKICYEGIENLANLRELRRLNMSHCDLMDDWCLQRFHIFGNSLQHLDISGCHSVTERGLATLYQLKNLQCLVVRNMLGVQNLELVCLLLQDLLPDCRIEGVDYDSPLLQQRLQPYLAAAGGED